MKKLIITLFTLFSTNLYFLEVLSIEPFVVLEHNSSNTIRNSNIDMYNPFLKDNNYSVTHEVKEGESLSGIINKYYKKTGLNMRIIEISIIEMNKKAFVRNNPNYLFAGKKIKIPSLNNIMQLVKTKPGKNLVQKKNSSEHIYFFGGN